MVCEFPQGARSLCQSPLLYTSMLSNIQGVIAMHALNNNKLIAFEPSVSFGLINAVRMSATIRSPHIGIWNWMQFTIESQCKIYCCLHWRIFTQVNGGSKLHEFHCQAPKHFVLDTRWYIKKLIALEFMVLFDYNSHSNQHELWCATSAYLNLPGLCFNIYEYAVWVMHLCFEYTVWVSTIHCEHFFLVKHQTKQTWAISTHLRFCSRVSRVGFYICFFSNSHLN